jgi:hypothetical protein
MYHFKVIKYDLDMEHNYIIVEEQLFVQHITTSHTSTGSKFSNS